MTDTLFIGDYAYSSWSLRGWLLYDRFGLPCRTHLVDFNAGEVAAQLADAGVAPAITVPSSKMSDGALVWDSLALAEELASRHPKAGIWPEGALARATARSLAAEMHSGFAPLRSACPMNLRTAYRAAPVSAEVTANLRRLEAIWRHARDVCGDDGPWLCGDYSAADAFYAPVAARIAGYGLAVDDAAAAYVAAHLADPAFRRWRAMGLVHGDTLTWYAQDHPTGAWPGPAPRPARAVAEGTPENDACPYSGKPPTHLMEMEGRVFGFCNAFCRDKTVADPEAWPGFMALV